MQLNVCVYVLFRFVIICLSNFEHLGTVFVFRYNFELTFYEIRSFWTLFIKNDVLIQSLFWEKIDVFAQTFLCKLSSLLLVLLQESLEGSSVYSWNSPNDVRSFRDVKETSSASLRRSKTHLKKVIKIIKNSSENFCCLKLFICR